MQLGYPISANQIGKTPLSTADRTPEPGTDPNVDMGLVPRRPTTGRFILEERKERSRGRLSYMTWQGHPHFSVRVGGHAMMGECGERLFTHFC